MFRRRIDKSDTLHQIYSNHKIKQQLINYIFSVVDLSKFKYKLLETHDDLQLLSTAKYYISGNYTGPNCLMVFTRNKDRYYSFIVDRKTLSYKQSQVNIDNVVINPIELGLEESIYSGTIIDGILSQTENSKVYIITDVYRFKDESLINEKIKYKLINIRSYLDRYMTQDKNVNNINVVVNKLYEISDIKNLVHTVIPQTKSSPVRGVAFYPETSGTKLIFLFNKNSHQDDDSHHNQTSHRDQNSDEENYNTSQKKQFHRYQQRHHDNNQEDDEQLFTHRDNFGNQQRHSGYPNQQNHSDGGSGDRSNSPDDIQISTKTKYRYVCKTTDPVILTFELRKTEQYDVYKLFLVTKCNDNGKSILKTKRFGIACIPTSACSKMCKELTVNTGKALVKCKYDDTKEKWIPIEADKIKKCPDYVSTLEEKMDVIVDEE